jgi:hypothetical protein
MVLLAVCIPLMALESRMGGSLVLVGKHYEVESSADLADTRAALDHLERFHDHLLNVFAGVITPWEGREVVRYCRDRDSFLAYGRAYCPGFSDGWYGYQAVATATAPAELVLMHLGNNRSVMQHEAFHRVMARAYPGIRAWPRWFDEGLADWIARGRFTGGRFVLPESLDPADLNRVRDRMSAQTLVPLERLLVLDNAAWNGADQSLHYAQAYLLVCWLMRTEERPWAGLMREFLQRLVRTQHYDDTFRTTFGTLGVVRMQQAWLEWLRAQR